MKASREWQFDGLVGPTHNYAGLAFGNKAAADNAGQVSNPRQAALQGLEKMRFVRDLGMPQAFFPPHPRPLVSILKRIGFEEDVARQLDQAYRVDPALLAGVFSSSFMWVANAATVSPSADTKDGRLHLTVANLTSHFHRTIETEFTHRLLQAIFHNTDRFAVNNYLPSTPGFGDEGAANHMRIHHNDTDSGQNIFIYGKGESKSPSPRLYPARQHLSASQAVARLHGLNPARTHFLQQAPAAIDRGVFHNDVIAMNTGSLMIAHAEAFVPSHQEWLRQFSSRPEGFVYCEIDANALTVDQAVNTYLFNSQLLQIAPHQIDLIAPSECEEQVRTRTLLSGWEAEGILHRVHYRDVRESMRNGGGPACLRLRVTMTESEAAAMHPGIVLTDARYTLLRQWIVQHYRDRLSADDFRDPLLLGELAEAYRALEAILEMPGLYGDWPA